MLVKLSQTKNAQFLIFVTLSGIVIFVKFLQAKNAPFPMLVTLSGIVILVKPDHINAKSPMLVTPSSITTFFILLLLNTGLL